MKSRRKAREAVLQALYQCDTLSEWTSAQADLCFKQLLELDSTKLQGSELDNFNFTVRIVNGVLEQRDFIDAQITEASTRWSIARMARVDRNILRSAVYEIGFIPEISVNVSINEAIELAKLYSTADSHQFINGVLDNIASVLKSKPDQVPADSATARPKLALAS